VSSELAAMINAMAGKSSLKLPSNGREVDNRRLWELARTEQQQADQIIFLAAAAAVAVSAALDEIAPHTGIATHTRPQAQSPSTAAADDLSDAAEVGTDEETELLTQFALQGGRGGSCSGSEGEESGGNERDKGGGGGEGGEEGSDLVDEQEQVARTGPEVALPVVTPFGGGYFQAAFVNHRKIGISAT
jgi:hypothetical protein